MLSFRDEQIPECSTLFHFLIISKNKMLRSEVGVKQEEGMRTERRFDPRYMSEGR